MVHFKCWPYKIGDEEMTMLSKSKLKKKNNEQRLYLHMVLRHIIKTTWNANAAKQRIIQFLH